MHNTYFTVNIAVRKGLHKPWFNKFNTYGNYKIIQFGLLGLYVQLNYGKEQ